MKKVVWTSKLLTVFYIGIYDRNLCHYFGEISTSKNNAAKKSGRMRNLSGEVNTYSSFEYLNMKKSIISRECWCFAEMNNLYFVFHITPKMQNKYSISIYFCLNFSWHDWKTKTQEGQLLLHTTSENYFYILVYSSIYDDKRIIFV